MKTLFYFVGTQAICLRVKLISFIRLKSKNWLNTDEPLHTNIGGRNWFKQLQRTYPRPYFKDVQSTLFFLFPTRMLLYCCIFVTAAFSDKWRKGKLQVCELFFAGLSHPWNNKTILNNCSLNYLLSLWCRCQCTRFYTTSCCVYLKRLSDTPVILLNNKRLFRQARTIPSLNYLVCTRCRCHKTIWTLSTRNCIRLRRLQNKTPCHMVWQVTHSVFHNMKA